MKSNVSVIPLTIECFDSRNVVVMIEVMIKLWRSYEAVALIFKGFMELSKSQQQELLPIRSCRFSDSGRLSLF